MIRDVYCRSQIPKTGSRFFSTLDLGSQVPDPGVKKALDPGFQILDSDPQHRFCKSDMSYIVNRKTGLQKQTEKEKPLREQDRAGPRSFLYTQYILPPCSLHSRPYCVQLQPTEETSVKSVSLYFLFPPKWATIPVTTDGLLYLTLDRRRDAGGKGRVETKVGYFSFFREI
jgi:hypothetical protein